MPRVDLRVGVGGGAFVFFRARAGAFGGKSSESVKGVSPKGKSSSSFTARRFAGIFGGAI
jgi:hypothetical protein